MTVVNFGAGTAIARRTDITNPTPSFLGILQDIEIDFDQTLKELIGQYKVAVDIAPAQLKITGKAKFARIESLSLRDLLFGAAAVVTPTSGFGFIVSEADNIPGSVTYTITVAQAATFLEDYGVFYASNGKQFQCVASAPTIGQYAVVPATGIYTFAAADASVPVYIYYSYGVTTLIKSVISNTVMGNGPTFELFISETYTNNLGQLNTFNLKLNACRASKMGFPFKNTDYTMQGFDFQAFADGSNTIGTLSTTE